MKGKTMNEVSPRAPWYEGLARIIARGSRFRSSYRVEAPGREGVSDHSRVLWSWLWGAFDTDAQKVDFKGQGLAQVTVGSNFAYDLVSVLTLGLVAPKIVRWKVAEPRPNPVDVQAAEPPSAEAPLFESRGQKRWIEPNPHVIERRVSDIIDVWNGEPSRPSVAGYNAVTKGFQAQLQAALSLGLPIRPMGGGWSYSRVLETDGLLFNTRPLTYTFNVLQTQVHDRFEGRAERLLFCQCGTTVNDVSRILTARGLSLPTTGAADRQTIVGAFSTGTHGSAIDIGSMQDFVVALHVIVSPERTVWLERASRPVVGDAYAEAFGVAPKDILRDDELFDAAVLSFGSFGIIHGAMVEARPIFHLSASRTVIPLDERLWRAIEHLDFSEAQLPRPGERPFHFALVVNPNNIDDGVYATVMYEDEVAPPGATPASSESSVGATTLELIGEIMTLLPPFTSVIQGYLLRRLYPEYENVYGTHAEIFSVVTARGKGTSVGMGIPMDRVKEGLNIVVDTVATYPAPIVVQLRFVPSSPATLAFTRYKPSTCILEIDGPRGSRVNTILERIWDAFEAAGIPHTFHWGKVNRLDRNRTRRIYGDAVDRWRNARHRLLPTKELRALFSNSFVEDLGLGE